MREFFAVGVAVLLMLADAEAQKVEAPDQSMRTGSPVADQVQAPVPDAAQSTHRSGSGMPSTGDGSRRPDTNTTQRPAPAVRGSADDSLLIPDDSSGPRPRPDGTVDYPTGTTDAPIMSGSPATHAPDA